MLTKKQIEEVGRLIEAREQQLSQKLDELNVYPTEDVAAELTKCAMELADLDELKPVLRNTYNELADVDADNLGESHIWLTNKMPHEETNISARLWWTLGYLVGKIDAGYVTEDDWHKMCLLRDLL